VFAFFISNFTDDCFCVYRILSDGFEMESSSFEAYRI
jgi:hypothetical protein